MSNESFPPETPAAGWQNESARQRWDLFHRAIAHAKRSNLAALDDGNAPPRRRGTRPVVVLRSAK